MHIYKYIYMGHLARRDGRVCQPFFPLVEELHDLDLRKTTSQTCEAVPRRARI